MDALKKLTSPFILRRTKETAAPDLPQKTESIFWCDMENEQRTAYEEIKAQVKKNIMVDISDKGLNKTKLGVLQGITKLRQVCSSPRLLKNEPDFSATPSIKIDSLIQLLTSDLADEKTVVFSQFLGTMDLLSDAFEKNGIDYRRFSGKTAAKERTRLVSEFQDDNSNIQVFLLSLMAGNSGINLTNASYVFLVEPWWNKAVQQQAIDRLHRIGQKQNVFAYNMICKNTIEEKILDLQRKKQILSDEVIADDSNFLKNMTEDDINFLFE
jgi:SNF2 family DNA or RNA helicase